RLRRQLGGDRAGAHRGHVRGAARRRCGPGRHDGGERLMRLVTAPVKPFKLDDVKDAPSKMDLPRLTRTQAKGPGRQRGHPQGHRGAEYVVDLIPKVRIEVLCDDDDADDVAATIVSAARTGSIGDGKVWITPVENVIRVRTGEMGVDAL